MSTSLATCRSLALWSASATSLLLLLFCLKTSTADGWSTNVWPSQAYPMEGYRQLSECYTATVERCLVAGVTPPVAVTNYLEGYRALTNIKQRIQTVIPSFLAATSLDTTSPVASNYFSARPGIATTLPLYSVTGLLWALYLPTNFFAYTPILGMSGLGAYTNDATTPYPHGFTNAFTQAGGTNFPASRTNWYDTDYGLSSIPGILSNLVWTTFTTTATSTNRYYGFGEASTWAGAKSAADAAYAPLSGSPSRYVFGGYGLYLGGGTVYNAKLYAANFRCQTTSLPTTQFVCSVEWYNWATNAAANVNEPVWDSLVLPLIENVFSYVGSATSTNTVTNLFVFGNTNKPAWCAAPPAVSAGESSLGFWFNDIANALKGVVRWDIAGGFTFK